MQLPSGFRIAKVSCEQFSDGGLDVCPNVAQHPVLPVRANRDIEQIVQSWTLVGSSVPPIKALSSHSRLARAMRPALSSIHSATSPLAIAAAVFSSM
jgi:hypothetical protein